jgi:hypothetical protein
VIADFLDQLASALGFDRALSRRVCAEIEDHLRERVAADPTEDRQAAERRALAACGDPRLIAAEFAVLALAKRTRRLGVGVLLAVAAVLIAMKARVAWLGAMPWAPSEELRAVAAVVRSIDGYAFRTALAIAIAIATWALIGGRRVPASFHAHDRRRLRRFSVLCGLAATALALSVVADTVLTTIRLLATEPSAALVVAIASIAFEVICAVLLAVLIRHLAQRTTATAALWKT